MLHTPHIYSRSPITDKWLRNEVERMLAPMPVPPAILPGVEIRPRASWRELVARVAVWHGVGVEDITGPRRFRRIVAARFDAVVAVHKAYPNLSSPRLGALFGGRDHSTILSALRRRGMR